MKFSFNNSYAIYELLQLSITNRQDKESEQIMNLLSSEDASNFKARSIALASALKIELADRNQRE